MKTKVVRPPKPAPGLMWCEMCQGWFKDLLHSPIGRK